MGSTTTPSREPTCWEKKSLMGMRVGAGQLRPPTVGRGDYPDGFTISRKKFDPSAVVREAHPFTPRPSITFSRVPQTPSPTPRRAVRGRQRRPSRTGRGDGRRGRAGPPDGTPPGCPPPVTPAPRRGPPAGPAPPGGRPPR